MRNMLPILILSAVAGCASTSDTMTVSEVISADLKRGDGTGAGVATISKRSDGTFLRLAADAPMAGSFGMHIHMVGKCEEPDFTSAGPHWNPGMKQHGRDNPMGAHGGDLPNIEAGVDQKLTLEYRLPDIVLNGEGGLLDADGAALVIHERADDYRTDPTGNSGKRIICGVFKSSR